MRVALVVFGLASIAAGGLAAGLARYVPHRAAMVEQAGAALFVTGIAVVGASFPAI
jgi:hypothetical protein